MMRIVRADDGEVFELAATLLDIDQSGPLKSFLSDVTAIDANAIICFLSDGTQLRNENLRELSGVEDQSIFVFNRESLELPVDQIVGDLMVEPQLQPEIDAASTYSSPAGILAAYGRAANFHYQRLLTRANSLHAQTSCLAVASLNLDSHVLNLTSAYDVFVTSAQRELEKQDEILRGHALDMEVIARVKVHSEFLNPNVRRAVEMGGKERHLGDYVSAHKMQMVADSCSKIHEDLVQRCNTTRTAMTDLSTGADEVRAGSVNPFVADIDHCVRRAKELSDRITQASPEDSLEEMRELDELLREEVRAMADLKNRVTVHCVDVLRNVSRLQSMLADLPPLLTALDSDLRLKAGFPHLQRLHNMLYFYGATIIEIVRRTEFGKLFMERSQTIAEMMAKLTANERKRRQVYRSEVHGQLPFEAKGMDEPVPSLEISTKGSKETAFTLTRNDLIEFLNLVDEIAATIPLPEQSDSQVAHPVQEIRAALDKHVAKIDTLEADFDKLAEKSILSASWSANFSKRRASNEVPVSVYREAVEQLQEKSEQERLLREDWTHLDTENRRLQVELDAIRTERDTATQQFQGHTSRIESLEEELDVVRDTLRSESAARRSVEQRHSDSLVEAIAQAKILEDALAEATTRTKEAEKLKFELSSAKDEVSRVCEQHRSSDERISALLHEQAETLSKVEDALARGTNLEAQLHLAREEGDRASKALDEAARENERLLRSQATEADRQLKDRIAEADGDRAVLEHQFAELHAQVDAKSREIGELKLALEMERADRARSDQDADAALLRQRTQLVAESRREVEALRQEVDSEKAAVNQLRHKTASQERVDGEIVQLVGRILDVSRKTMATVQKYSLSKNAPNATATPGPTPGVASTVDYFGAGDASMIMSSTTAGPSSSTFIPSSSSFPPAGLRSPLSNGTRTLDIGVQSALSSPEAALAALSAFDLDAFTETMNKTGLTIRKWQKQCRDYRDKSKSKITYHNFTKGDLALFLPTRNSVAKPWAAFNVSFPHYFLSAQGHQAEQLKTREWVVARITSIVQRVADNNVPESNPFGLGNGVKYFMLEVEDWTQPQAQAQLASLASTSTASPHRHQPNVVSRKSLLTAAEEIPAKPAPPPEPESETARIKAATPPPASSSPPRTQAVNQTTEGWPQIRASEELGEGPGMGSGSGSVIRRPLPQHDEESESLQHAMARSPPGPFVPLLDPILQQQRKRSPSPAQRLLSPKRHSVVPPEAVLSKVLAEGGKASAKGKEKEHILSASPGSLATIGRADASTPSPVPSSRSKTATPLSVPFSGRNAGGGGLGRRSSVMMSASVDVSAGTSPGAQSFLNHETGPNTKSKASAVTGTTTALSAAPEAIDDPFNESGTPTITEDEPTSPRQTTGTNIERARTTSMLGMGWSTIASTWGVSLGRRNGTSAASAADGTAGPVAALLKRYESSPRK